MKKLLFFTLILALGATITVPSASAETSQQCVSRLENNLAISGGFGSLSGNLKLIEDTEEDCYPANIDTKDQCLQRVNAYSWDSLTQIIGANPSQIESTKNNLLLHCTSKFISTNITLETQGACSSHLGVNCKIGEDSDGSVICNDGHLDSSVLYALVDECKEHSSLGSIIMPDYSVNLPTIISNGNIFENMKDELAGFHELNLKTINLMHDALKIYGDYFLEIGRLSFQSEDLLRSEIDNGAIFNQLLDNLNDLDKKHNSMRDEAIENIKELKTNLLNAKDNLKYIKNDSYVVTAVNDVASTEKDYLEIIEKSSTKWNLRKEESRANIEKKRKDYLASQQDIISNVNIAPTDTALSSTIIFTDIEDNHRQATAIKYLKRQGIIQGYADGSFKANNTVNRAELMKILIGDSLPNGTYENCFKDVHQEWFAPYVCYAKNQGWVQGYSDNTFKPAQTVNRAEAIKMAIEVFGITLPQSISANPYPDTDKSQWFAPYVSISIQKGLFDSSMTNYRPSEGMQRGDVSDIIYRLLVIKKLQIEKYESSLDINILN